MGRGGGLEGGRDLGPQQWSTPPALLTLVSSHFQIRSYALNKVRRDIFLHYEQIFLHYRLGENIYVYVRIFVNNILTL